MLSADDVYFGFGSLVLCWLPSPLSGYSLPFEIVCSDAKVSVFISFELIISTQWNVISYCYFSDLTKWAALQACVCPFDFSTLLYGSYLRELWEILGYVCAVSVLALLSASLLLVENQRLEICLLCLSRSCHIEVSISCHCPLADTVLFQCRRL